MKYGLCKSILVGATPTTHFLVDLETRETKPVKRGTRIGWKDNRRVDVHIPIWDTREEAEAAIQPGERFMAYAFGETEAEKVALQVEEDETVAHAKRLFPFLNNR